MKTHVGSPLSVALVCAFGLILAGCSTIAPPVSGGDAMTPTLTRAAKGMARPANPTPTPTPGLEFRLAEGVEQPPAAQDQVLGARETPLSPAEVGAVLARLAAVTPEPDDSVAFALPPTTLPRPRTGETIRETFPPAPGIATPASEPSAPVEVLRHAPEGDVPIAPSLSVTFNQAMVPLTAIADLAARDVPVKLVPAPPGQWRWVGTKTLFFEPSAKEGVAPRFPMATTYSVEVPAGTTSATGARLGAPVKWTFRTPPPDVTEFMPQGGPAILRPVMVAVFDQLIDPKAVLGTIRLEAGGRRFDIRLAADAEIAADPAAKALTSRSASGRWLAFVPVDVLPGDARATVTIGPGTPSAEGPDVTTAGKSFSFRTFGPLKLVEHQCGWNGECPPGAQWTLRFSNHLDAAAFDTDAITISPELPGRQIFVWGDMIAIQGAGKAKTTYSVTVPGSLQDVFGQTLGNDARVTFTVGNAQPYLQAGGEYFITLDPAAGGTFPVYSINFSKLSVRGYRVTPNDWAAYRKYAEEAYRSDNKLTPPGKLVISRQVDVVGPADELVETRVDLRDALTDGKGHVVLVIEGTPRNLADLLAWRRGNPVPLFAWIQSTNIGLDAFVDSRTMVAWANDLRTGAPLARVDLALFPESATTTTGTDGTASLVLPDSRGSTLLVATLQGETAILPASPHQWWQNEWQKQPRTDTLRWYVFDDRGLYRPGETVHVKGWLRVFGAGPGGDLGSPQGSVTSVGWRLSDAQGNQVATGSQEVRALDAFDFQIELPEGMNLGPASLELNASSNVSLDGTSYVHSLQVQEFRRPEYEVTTQADEGPHFVGGSAEAQVSARYFAGGGLQNADVTWQVTASPGHYAPPGWDDFTFGRWVPWWGGFSEFKGRGGFFVPPQTYSGKTDAAGIHRLHLDFVSATPPEAYALTAEATVTDVNRQAWTSVTNLLVHPAELYVGLRTPRLFVQAGEPVKLDLIVADLDGKAIAGREVNVRAARVAWQYRNGRWLEEEVDFQTCQVQSATSPVSCEFTTTEGGTLRIEATVRDDREQLNRSELTRWISGGRQPKVERVEQETVTLIPDRQDYQPGDTAEILVQAPFFPAEGLLTLQRAGIVSTQRFTMEGPGYTLRIPIEESYLPGVLAQVDLVGSAERDTQGAGSEAPRRPAFATGSLNLAVPPLARTLKVEATPRETRLAPGEETSVDVTVLDASGNPVPEAELAIVVVDEAILALTGYQVADPIAAFYSGPGGDVAAHHLRESIVLASSRQFAEAQSQAGGRGAVMDAAAAPTQAPMATAVMAKEAQSIGGGGPAAAPIAIRTNFDPLALFAPSVRTDAQGRASVRIKLPDNLTRYRVIVIAVSGPSTIRPLGGKEFGKGESAITARLPLMVRPSAPRFLNFGDRFELPVVVQNQTDVPMTVDVAARATNLDLVSSGYRVTVPANDRVEVRLPAETASAGTARIQIAGVSGSYSDAATVELPVWTPATTEAFAVYGVIDSGAVVQPVEAPKAVYREFGGLEITTSSTALQELTDSFLYLVAYPFECSEQLASRVLAIAALRDVLTAFNAAGLPPASEIESAVTRDVERLSQMQNADGGFPIWRRSEESWPYHTIHVTHALQRAKLKGYDVPSAMLEQAQAYLRGIETRYPSWYGPETRRSLTAYALFVRNLMGDRDTARARNLLAEVPLDRQNLEVIGWLLPILSDDAGSSVQVAEIRRHLQNRVSETASTAQFAAGYGDQDYVMLYSDRRAEGILLDALIGDQPESDLIPKLVRGLLSARKAGRWYNTQDNAFILLALDRYFRTYEAQTPDFVARAWLGETYAGESSFKGRTTDYKQIDIPMSFLTAEKPQDLTLAKEGAGRLYYRLGLRYAPTDLALPPYDAGFTVVRRYEAVDDPADVRRDSEGSWHIRAGARVRVHLTMVATARRYHVALVDPLPAGLEPLNPALATTGSLPGDTGVTPLARTWWWGPWFEHQNLRDQRAEAFTSFLWEGVHTYTYLARATTPGTFIAPPAKAEEMYAPETFGRTGIDRVIVESAAAE